MMTVSAVVPKGVSACLVRVRVRVRVRVGVRVRGGERVQEEMRRGRRADALVEHGELQLVERLVRVRVRASR